jgi:hypothetical protein
MKTSTERMIAKKDGTIGWMQFSADWASLFPISRPSPSSGLWRSEFAACSLLSLRAFWRQGLRYSAG